MPVTISAAVEGVTDEAVARRLIAYAGAQPGSVFGKNGKASLKQKIAGYNNAARHAPWVVLVDLDQDADCAPPLRAEWLPAPAPHLCFRVVVRAVEAWLIADAEALADFFSIARGRIPHDPESLANPKESLVNLVRASRRKEIRDDILPREGSGRSIGPAYVSRIIDFASSHWRPGVAAHRSESLRRAIACLKNLANAA